MEREPDDILNVVRRPAAGRLGSDAIRFSTQPSLGGRAYVVEAVKADAGAAHIRMVWLSGHPRTGWRREGSARFDLSAAAYRRLASLIDRFLTSYRLPTVAENGETIVCNDGPEALTERVKDGKVTTLAGSCPPDQHELHPNRHIEAAMLTLACSRLTRGAPADAELHRNCARWETLAASDRRDAGQ